MSPIKVRLAGTKLGFEPVPAGYYVVTCAEAQEGVSKAGKPKLVLKWQIVEPEEYVGRLLWHHVSLMEGALYSLKEILLAAGWDEDDVNAEEGVEFEAADLVGESVCVAVTETEYDGKPSNQIENYFPVESFQ